MLLHAPDHRRRSINWRYFAINCSRQSFARIPAAAVSLCSIADADAPVVGVDRFTAVADAAPIDPRWHKNYDKSIVDRWFCCSVLCCHSQQREKNRSFLPLLRTKLIDHALTALYKITTLVTFQFVHSQGCGNSHSQACGIEQLLLWKQLICEISFLGIRCSP